MTAICHYFDDYFDKWAAQTGALCFLLCRDRAGADYAAFQSLLRLGGTKNKDIPEQEARMLLFKSAVRLSDDFYLKKMHRAPSQKKLAAMELHFAVNEPMYALLRLPFRRRAALALSHFGFDEKEISDITGRTLQGVKKLLAAPPEGWEKALDAMLLTEDQTLELSDRIYERFAERTVSVENVIHDLRNGFDRIAPYLAAAALALCAYAVWYVKKGM